MLTISFSQRKVNILTKKRTIVARNDCEQSKSNCLEQLPHNQRHHHHHSRLSSLSLVSPASQLQITVAVTTVMIISQSSFSSTFLRYCNLAITNFISGKERVKQSHKFNFLSIVSSTPLIQPAHYTHINLDNKTEQIFSFQILLLSNTYFPLTN